MTDFGRTIQSCVGSCADELQDTGQRWSDEQRHEVERILCVHMLSMHARGMRDASRLIRLHPDLALPLRNDLADQIDAAILQRREFV